MACKNCGGMHYLEECPTLLEQERERLEQREMEERQREQEEQADAS